MKKGNPFEKEVKNLNSKTAAKEIEKSVIYEALQNENTIPVKKTGKEIKEQLVSVVIPYVKEKLSSHKAKEEEILKQCLGVPTEEVYQYGIKLTKEEFPYNRFSWKEVTFKEPKEEVIVEEDDCCDCEDSAVIYKEFGDIEENGEAEISEYAPTKEVADLRAKYNHIIEEIRDYIIDLKTAEVLKKNISDTQEYWLNAKQLMALKF